MSAQKRATVSFDPSLPQALRVKAASTDHSVSGLVTQAISCEMSWRA
jgi:hypothetical protein